ncbi:GspH/FimT family pseudopilin [Alteromonas sp. CYL-A6]|uniref:GspH/FimT family pseudopilin n=1 Tax=Alteromonas nitratireducens TaxID=3390813 RepID=UPI0034BFB019
MTVVKTPFATQHGITLTECLLVVALVALLATKGVPAFGVWREKLSLRADLDKAISVLRTARNYALTTQTNAYVTLSPGANWCLAVSDTPTCDCHRGDCAFSSARHVAYGSSHASLVSGRFTAEYPIQFSGPGSHAFDAAGTLTFTSDSLSGKVIISPLGRIRHCSTDRALAGIPAC